MLASSFRHQDLNRLNRNLGRFSAQVLSLRTGLEELKWTVIPIVN